MWGARLSLLTAIGNRDTQLRTLQVSFALVLLQG